MLFPKRMLITALCCLSTLSLASTLPSSIQGQSLPDKWHQISLNETISGNTSLSTRDTDNALVERTPIRVCERIVATTAACVVITNFAITMCKSLGTTIKELSNKGTCNMMRGSYEGLRWSYHSSGRNCDTTAQQATIAGAIKKYMTNVEHDKICGTHCLRMDHGGTWDGWLKLGPVNSFNDGAYCGPELSFVRCLSGGNNDI